MLFTVQYHKFGCFEKRDYKKIGVRDDTWALMVTFKSLFVIIFSPNPHK